METEDCAGVMWQWLSVIELPIRDGNLARFVAMVSYTRVIELPIRDGN